MTMFQQYVSNVACGTGTNYILEFPENRRFTARGYFKPTVPGDYKWRFYMMNTVNSTYSDGSVAYRNKSGGSWVIRRAFLADGGEIGGYDVAPGEVTNVTPVLFGGRESYAVKPDERFRSDEVSFSIPENHYLVFEWEIEGNGIPCTPDSQVPLFKDTGSGWLFDEFTPMPALFGCDRPVKKRIAFWGDSITEGCGTRNNAYEMWAGRLGEILSPDYAVWNLGLGWARASDAVTGGSWFEKAKENDAVCLAFGVNDLKSGAYGKERGDTAKELLLTIETLVKMLRSEGIDVILATVPPFEFTKEAEHEWREVNTEIPALARHYGCGFFDLDAALEGNDRRECRYPYGSHPNGIGGKIAAEAFVNTFLKDKNWIL